MNDQNKIIMYGTRWCGDTRRSRKVFEKLKVEYEWINIDQDHEAETKVKEINNGFRSVPTILFPDGSILVEPSDNALEQKLSELKLF